MRFIGGKSLLFSICLLASMGAFAQVRLGIKAGLNLADLEYELKDQSFGNPGTNSLPSFNAGFIVEIPLAKAFVLQPGIEISGKGAKVGYTTSSLGDYKQTINPVYVELPVNLLFNHQIEPQARLYFGAGPYLAMGIAGKEKFNYENTLIGNGNTNHNLEFGNGKQDDLKAIDVGANVLAGFEFSKGLLIGVQYGVSLTNNAPNTSNSALKVLRNKVLSFSVGYLFGK